MKCEDCYGPIVGHLEKKCPKEDYSYEDVVKFEEYIENMEGFQEAIWEEKKRMREEEEKVRVKGLEEEERVKMESNNKKESEIEEEMVENLEKETKELKDEMKEIIELLKVF